MFCPRLLQLMLLLILISPLERFEPPYQSSGGSRLFERVPTDPLSNQFESPFEMKDFTNSGHKNFLK